MNFQGARASQLRMARLRGIPLGLALLLAWAAPAAAGERESISASPATTEAAGCLDRAVDAIQARYETVRDFSAHFEQRTRPAQFGAGSADPTPSSGRVIVAKPARMRWSYESPEPSVVVSDGETLWLYDPAFREAQRLPVGEGFLSGAAVQFLLGEGNMRRDFTISLEACEPDRVELLLVPREPASYQKLRIVASPQTGDLTATEIHDLLGNVTHVSFSQVEFNRDPAPETFRFTPPEGVTVVDLTTQVAPGMP